MNPNEGAKQKVLGGTPKRNKQRSRGLVTGPLTKKVEDGDQNFLEKEKAEAGGVHAEVDPGGPGGAKKGSIPKSWERKNYWEGNRAIKSGWHGGVQKGGLRQGKKNWERNYAFRSR